MRLPRCSAGPRPAAAASTCTRRATAGVTNIAGSAWGANGSGGGAVQGSGSGSGGNPGGACRARDGLRSPSCCSCGAHGGPEGRQARARRAGGGRPRCWGSRDLHFRCQGSTGVCTTCRHRRLHLRGANGGDLQVERHWTTGQHWEKCLLSATWAHAPAAVKGFANSQLGGSKAPHPASSWPSLQALASPTSKAGLAIAWGILASNSGRTARSFNKGKKQAAALVAARWERLLRLAWSPGCKQGCRPTRSSSRASTPWR